MRKRREKVDYNYPEDTEWRGINQFFENIDSSDRYVLFGLGF
jgi:hypothetical protein